MSVTETATIDLNADVGEGMQHDAELMCFITSANIACGAHAGDDDTIDRTLALARRHNVAIGAHPGHADRDHFGRRELVITPGEAASLVVEQVARLSIPAGELPRHVKLHGGLYHQVARERSLADAVAAALVERWPSIILFAPAGSILVAVAQERGLRVAAEAFVDRSYAPDGRLQPRSKPGAVITDRSAAASRAVRLVRDQVIETSDGTLLSIHADTLCIHGDGSDPVGLAATVRQALDAAGIAVKAIAAR